MQALALVPSEGAVRLRGRFQALEIDDERLLTRLSELARRQVGAGAPIAQLVRSYADQKGRCSLCFQPTSMDPIPISGGTCDDWCLDATRMPPYAIAHKLCAKQHSDIHDQQQQEQEQKPQHQNRHEYEKEQMWLLHLQNEAKNPPIERSGGGGGGGGGLVEGLFDRYCRIICGLRSVVRAANEPPHSLNSQWLDEEKTRLQKRCHKTLCCGRWNPVSILKLRRPIKPGQIDSSDFFACICPNQSLSRQDKFNQDQFKPEEKAMREAKIDEKRVAGAVAEATRLLQEQEEAGDGFATRRQQIAKSTYALHQRLLPLFVASDTAKIVLPKPPDEKETIAEIRWFAQSGKCGICGQKIKLSDPLHWDLGKGQWMWMHASCNPNAWRNYMAANTPLSDSAKQKDLYEARHSTDQLFDETIARVRQTNRIALEQELLEPLRQRAANLAEQALVQTRFGAAKFLRDQLLPWLHELRAADPDAANSIQFDDPQPKPKPKPKLKLVSRVRHKLVTEI